MTASGAARPVPALHVITDPDAPAGLSAVVDAALGAGAPAVQVRLKGATDRALFDLAADLTRRCHAAGAACIVDDRVDVALAVGANGVHVGADDLPVAAVRRLAGPGLVVGATARDPATARAHQQAGADYLGVGPVWTTATKAELPAPLGIEGLARIAAAVTIPVIAISGVTAERVADVLAAGAHGVAVVAAVSRAGDPTAATAALVRAVAAAPAHQSTAGDPTTGPAAR